MKLFPRRVDEIDKLKKQRDKLNMIWHNMLKSSHDNDTGCKSHDEALRKDVNSRMNDVDSQSAEISDQINAVCIERINTFPLHLACTTQNVSTKIGLCISDVEDIMFYDLYMGSYIDAYNVEKCINAVVPDRVEYVDRSPYDNVHIRVIKLPNWRFVKSGITKNMYVERI